MKKGEKIDHVGMNFDFSNTGQVKVTMSHCVQDILSGCGVTGTATTLVSEDIFEVRDGITKATEEERKWFHTYTAKLLYLVKRGRSECLTAVSFLATRVSQCDTDDLIYIDAAYGVHLGSGKSHSRYPILVGRGPPEVSSTELELVAPSDYASAGINLKNFIRARPTQPIH